MTPTTFALTYKGRQYWSSCDHIEQHVIPTWTRVCHLTTETSFQVGNKIAYRDIDDPDDVANKRYHIEDVVNIADGEAHVHCFSFNA